MPDTPAATPEPPYWAVVFTSVRTDRDPDGYADAARRMLELAARQPGFLGAESVRGADGAGITVSYWDSPEAIAAWRGHAEHRAVQRLGAERWYARYAIRVCRVERVLAGGRGGPP
jgi:heme-degrading monooxygenase HmoA